MAEILVLGAGLGGLSTAMLLARGGHQVTVLERDPAEPPPAAQAWEAWERRGINQFRLPHLMLPRWRAQMELELPRSSTSDDRRWPAPEPARHAPRTRRGAARQGRRFRP